MNNFNKYFGIHAVKSADDRTVKCRYRHHALFDINCPIFYDLHFVFVHFTSERAYTQGYNLNNSYCNLFDYLSNKRREKGHVDLQSITDINSEIFNGFQLYLKKTAQSIFLASTLKNALTSVAEATGKIALIQLPIVDLPKRVETEPLNQEAFDSLSNALSTHIDSLYEKLQFRKKVDMAVPYDLETVKGEFTTPYTLANIFRWYQHSLSSGSTNAKKTYRIKAILKKSTDATILNLGEDKDLLKLFRNLYATEGPAYQLDSPANPFEGDGIRNWRPDDERTIKTLLSEGYPMDISLSQHTDEFISSKINSAKRCDSVTKLLMHRYLKCNNYKGDLFNTPNWDDLLGMYFPTMVDMSAIVLFIMLQSGWNKETVLAIDSSNFEDIFNGMINDSITMVFSEKQRSQSIGTPFFTPKRFSALSSKDDKYSIHNLILLAQELSAPLKNYQFDFINLDKDESSLNPLFLCIRYFADWGTKGGRHTSSSNQKAFAIGTKHFLQKYPVFENGHRLITPGDFTLRLRPTWIKYKKKNNPLSILSLQQGHDDTNTTDVYYDSSGAAMQERYELLRSALEEIMGLLRRREFSGLMSKAATQLSEEKLRLFTIPGSENAMWGCSNQLRPDWPGHQKVVAQNEKCYEISKCLFCSKVRIFENSLPYLIERLQQISDKQSDFDDTVSAENDEVQIIQYILDSWKDQDAVKQAARIQHRSSPMLPNDLSSLKLIFSEENKS